MGLFNNYNKIEKGLLELYSEIFARQGIPNAKQTAKELLDSAIEESKKIGSYNYPSNSGDLLLEKEKTNPKTHQILERGRKEGVRNEDIRWWWNMNDVERMMMLKTDEFFRMALFIKLRQEGKTPEEAGIRVKKFHPIYGNPDDTTHGSGDDRPFPVELKDTVNIYIEKRAKIDPEKNKKEIEESSSLNALIRREIRSGNL